MIRRLILICLFLFYLPLQAEIKIAVVGDSISLFLPWSKLEALYSQEGKNVKFINRSLPGMRSAQGYHQFLHVLEDHQPDIVIYGVGFCSGFFQLPIEHIQEMLEMTIKIAQSKNIKFLLGTIELSAYPNDIINANPFYTSQFERMHQLIAKKHKIADFPLMFKTVIQSPLYTPDKVHPGPIGYDLIIPIIKTALDPLLS